MCGKFVWIYLVGLLVGLASDAEGKQLFQSQILLSRFAQFLFVNSEDHLWDSRLFGQFFQMLVDRCLSFFFGFKGIFFLVLKIL